MEGKLGHQSHYGMKNAIRATFNKCSPSISAVLCFLYRNFDIAKYPMLIFLFPKEVIN